MARKFHFLNKEIKQELKINKSIKFRLGIFDILRFYSPFSSSVKLKLFSKVKIKNKLHLSNSQAIELIKNKLDIRNVLKNMMETEKFKLLFFDKNQYCIFQELPKPLIYDKYMYENGKRSLAEESIELSHMEKFWESRLNKTSQQYQAAIERLKQKQKLDAIDERLLELVGGK